MCGRVVVDYEGMAIGESDRDIVRWVGEGLEALGTPPTPSWNLAPTQPVPLLIRPRKAPETHRVELARWGIVPPWEKAFATKYPTFNARIESVAEKRTFAPSLVARRCAVLTTGYYEWLTEGKVKTPHVIGGHSLLPLAGLYSWWREPGAPEGEGWRLSATVLTRESTGPLASIHDRMPVFLDDALAADWLDPEQRADHAMLGAVSGGAERVAASLNPVAVRPITGDGPELIVPRAEREERA
ncbi:MULTISPECIES: SOS response-associated peptidase [unclassified Leucobacter]|uniref:SOS response-associated peptidase n=1 Tax=unclassified Leucobacter TaxID=2621730 RepID=UPI00165E95BB|nr:MULTISPECIES: SOS response-associated peptidase [unclassified Leucobacter]MBC9927722.1 SOS response-associated peptidase [Leucobacter sp. cx-169]